MAVNPKDGKAGTATITFEATGKTGKKFPENSDIYGNQWYNDRIESEYVRKTEREV